jgi:hypothetical protein
MQQRNERWLRGRRWREALDEVRRFLDTWYFYISSAGHLYVRPIQQAISSRDVRAFFRRLDLLGTERLPVTMSFDFTKVQLSNGRRLRIAEMLRQYADDISAGMISISSDTQFGDLLVILRRTSADDQRPQPGRLQNVSGEQRPETMLAAPSLSGSAE